MERTISNTTNSNPLLLFDLLFTILVVNLKLSSDDKLSIFFLINSPSNIYPFRLNSFNALFISFKFSTTLPCLLICFILLFSINTEFLIPSIFKLILTSPFNLPSNLLANIIWCWGIKFGMALLILLAFMLHLKSFNNTLINKSLTFSLEKYPIVFDIFNTKSLLILLLAKSSNILHILFHR